MRKVFRNVRKVTGYCLLYLIITLGAAVGSLFLLTSVTSKGSTGNKVTIAPQISKIYNNLSSKEALHLNLDLNTEGSVNLALNLDTDIKIDNENDNFQLQGLMELEINNDSLPLEFCFKDGNLYLEMCNAKFVINTSDVSQSLDQILSSLGFSLSSLGINMQDLTLENLLGMLSDLQETIENDKIILDINVPVVGTMQVICDLNYNIKSLSLPQAAIENTVVALDLNLSYPQNVKIIEPQEQFLNIDSMFEVLSSTIDYLTNDKLGMEIGLSKDNLNFTGNLYANLKDQSIKFEMDLLGQNARLYVLNKVLYIELGNLNFKFDLNALPEALNILNSHFNLNLPVEFIQDVLSTPKEDILNLNFSQLLTANENSTLSNLDLSIVESFTQEGNIYTIKLKDIGHIDFHINNGTFESLSYIANNFSLTASSIPSKDISLSDNSNSYIDLAQTLPVIDATISTTEEDYILANGVISIAGLNGDITMALDLTSPRLNLNLFAFGKEIHIDYLDDVAFLNFDDICLRGTKDEITSLLERLGVNFDPNSIIDTVKNWIDPEKNESFVKDLEAGNDYLKITLLDDKIITLYFDTKITKIEISMGTTQVELNLTYPESPITFLPIDEEQYSPASIVLEKIAKTYEYIKNKNYYIEITGNTPLNTLQGFVNYDGQKLEASLEIENENNYLGIIIAEQTIYLTVNEDLISFPINDLKDALNILKNTISPDLITLANNLDLNYLVENILQSIVLEIEQSNILFSFKNLKFNVEFENDSLSNIQINGVDFNGMIKIQDVAHSLPQFDKNKYIAVTTLIEKATALSEYINENEHYLTLNAQYKGFVIDGILNHQNETISALLQLRSNDTALSLRVQDRTIFIDYSDLHISCDYDNLQELLNLLNEELGTNLTNIICKLINSIKFDSSLVDKILSNSKLNFTDDNLTFGFDNLLAEIYFNENKITSAKLNYLDISASIYINSLPTNIERVNEKDYLPLNTLIGKLESVLTFIKSKQLYLKFNANYSSLNLVGYLNIDEEGISLLASTEIDGVEWKIKLIENVIYLKKNNLKLQFNLDQIETVKQFLSDEFNIDLTTILNTSLDLAKIFENANLKIENNAIIFTYGDLLGKIGVNQNGLLEVKINYNDLSLQGNSVSNKTEVEVKGKYTQIETILPFVTAFKDYLSSKQYNITANANVYEKDTQIYTAQNMLFQLDLTEKIKFYASAIVSGIKDTKAAGFNLNLSACGDQSNVYVDYNGLGLKISQNDFEKIIQLALKLFKMESFSEVANNLLNGKSIDLDEIINIITQSAGELSLSYINMLEKIDVENNALKIIVDGSSISTTAKATQMEIVLQINNGVLSQISFKNFYTGVTHDEHFDFDVYFNDYNGVTAPNQNKKYIDFTSSSDLIEAVLNTVVLDNTFEISGALNIRLKVGLIDIDWNLSVNVQVRIVNGKIEMQACVWVIPVIDLVVYNLNNDTPWGSNLFNPLSIKNRMLYIYFKDNYFYFYRHETKDNGDSYQKAMKAHMDSVFDDVLYYVKWGTGFNDDIIDAIKKSINESDNYTPNLNNIINGFSCPAQNQTNYYTLSLNLNELTGDDKMGDLEIGASIKNENGKNIISGLSFNMDMPLIWGTTLYMKADPLTLSHGITLNMDMFNKIVNGFSRGKESVEYSAINGYWGRDGERTYTINFEAGFDDISLPSISGNVNSRFILPKPSNKVIGTKHEGIDYTVYQFAGWYTNKNFATGSEFKKGIIPAKNITLYAKWVVKEGYRTISYYNNGILVASDYALIGSPLRMDIISKYVEYEQNNILYKKEFVNWTDKNGIAVEVVPEESECLYANYQIYQVLNKRTLTVVQGIGGSNLTMPIFETLELKDYLPQYEQISITKNTRTSFYAFRGWFIDSECSIPAPSVMPASNLTIYAKWEIVKESIKQYTLKIIDNDKVYSTLIEPDMPISFAKDMPICSTTRWYSDSSYLVLTSRPILMPAHDVTYYIKNKYTVSYTYYVLEYGQFTTKVYSAQLYQGAKFTLQKLVDFEETVKVENIPVKRVGYYFHGYKTYDGKDVDSNIMPNHDLTFSATYTTKSKSYFKLTFHCDWVTPAWWVSSGNSETSTNRTLKDIYVLEGSYIIGSTLYNVVDLEGTIQERSLKVDLSRSYIGPRYWFDSAAWNTTECKNLYKSAFGNSGENDETIYINSDTDLYVEWQHI